MMDREIKFRGKRIDNGEWVFGYYTKEWYADGVGGSSIRYYIYDFNTQKQFKVIPETVGQFTGLRDKNDKEIYEGDIIVGEPEIKMIVEWDERVGCFCGIAPKMMVRINGTSFHKKEIVGNIYDNPELQS